MLTAVLLSHGAGSLGCGGDAAEARVGARPNIVMISMDTLRADRVGRLGQDGTSLTPALDVLAEQAEVFERAYSQSNETLFSHTSVFTGRYPTKFGELDYLTYRLPRDSQTIAADLGSTGYRTEAIVAGGHLAPVFGLFTGFDRYASMDNFSTFQQTVPQALDALSDLASGDEPFFLFVHGYDCHTPYIKPGPLFRIETPRYEGDMLEAAKQPLTYERILGRSWFPAYQPPEVSTDDALKFIDPAMFDDLAAYAQRADVERVALSDEDVDFLKGSYDAAVRYADSFVGLLFDQIDELGLADNTVVIVFSDHGEDLLDHGYFNHRLALYDENLHVPIMIRIPNGTPRRVDAPVALVDLYATVRDLAGLPQDAQTPGIVLTQTQHDPARAIYSESLRGEVSVRNAMGRLILPRSVQLGGVLPEMAPTGALVLGDDGRVRPWSGASVAQMWSQLGAQRPQ